MKEPTSQEVPIKVITDQVLYNPIEQEVPKKEEKVASEEHLEATEVEVVNGDKYNLRSEMRKLSVSHQHKILNFHINKEK
jgi:hypothetical protein